MTFVGEAVENLDWLFESQYKFKDRRLGKTVLGVRFENPIGLSAGFDYDGHLARVMKHIGFGFNTVGTVTARAYEGNKKPRLVRLVESKSILVNKGFKSSGALEVARRLNEKDLRGHTIGISVGSSNVPEVNTINKAIEDYLFTFDVFKDKRYVKYFELNISCPNTSLTESFIDTKNFRKLAREVKKLNLEKPFFVKMPSEATEEVAVDLINESLKQDIRGFIFSNLVKDRKNKHLVRSELERVADYKGNFSGKPTFENSNRLIKVARKKFGNEIAIIGCGGVFNAHDAAEKFKAGADLVQLVTGMIFEGPQIAGEINSTIWREQLRQPQQS